MSSVHNESDGGISRGAAPRAPCQGTDGPLEPHIGGKYNVKGMLFYWTACLLSCEARGVYIAIDGIPKGEVANLKVCQSGRSRTADG